MKPFVQRPKKTPALFAGLTAFVLSLIIPVSNRTKRWYPLANLEVIQTENPELKKKADENVSWVPLEFTIEAMKLVKTGA